MRQDLWHLRSLSRCVPERNYVDTKRVWRDWTRYQNRTVPRSIMEEVYKASGDEMEFLEGRIGATLGGGDAPWAILRAWRDTVDDDEALESVPEDSDTSASSDEE